MKFSVITINYNNADGLRKTIKSVINQTCHDFEYIVIDGGSIDGSKAIIEEHERYISYWVSEKDAGIYNAMNKGVAVAHGEYCIFMNSGDCFCGDKVLDTVYKERYSEDIFVGTVLSSITGCVVSPPPVREISLYHLYSGAIPHQGAFIRRTLLREYPYDETMKISSDWKFFVQTIILNNCSFRYIDKCIAVYDMQGISSVCTNEMFEEKQQYLSEILPDRILSDYRYMKSSECLTNTLSYRFRENYSIDKFIYKLGCILLNLKKIIK